MKAEHIKEFSKNAYRYDAHTALQQEVARHLLSRISHRPHNVLDLGCGSGAVYKQLPWKVEHFIGVDQSEAMCELHPKNDTVTLICENFESKPLFEKTVYDLIISSSALQWASDLEALLAMIATSCRQGAFAIFCDKTFLDVYALSQLPTFLPNAQAIIDVCQKHFLCHHEVKTYRLFFENNKEIFSYIKKSGVSGGRKALSVAQTKRLIREYPHAYLEFEVLYTWGISHQNNNATL